MQRTVSHVATIAGILLAALLVWVGFWDADEPNGAFALVWLYFATSLTLVAIIWVAYDAARRPDAWVSSHAVGFLVAAFEMLFLQVGQSLVSNAMKVYAQMIGVEYAPVSYESRFVYLALVITPLIVVTAYLGTHAIERRSHDKWEVIPWIANSVLVFVLYCPVIRMMCKALPVTPGIGVYVGPALAIFIFWMVVRDFRRS